MAGLCDGRRTRKDTASPLVAALFPVTVNVHLVANRVVVVFIGLCGSDRAQGNDGCGNGESKFLHYKTLKSVLWSYRSSTTRAASARKHATLRVSRVGTRRECVCQCNTVSVPMRRNGDVVCSRV
jgi:hypothetical protein